MSQIHFTRRKQYLKRSSFCDSVDMAAPSVVAPWFNYVSTLPIPHNLGYVPDVRVGYEPNNDGVVYPATGRRLSGTGLGLSPGDIICLWEVTETELTIYLESTASHAGTIPVHYIIYLRPS